MLAARVLSLASVEQLKVDLELFFIVIGELSEKILLGITFLPEN